MSLPSAACCLLVTYFTISFIIFELGDVFFCLSECPKSVISSMSSPRTLFDPINLEGEWSSAAFSVASFVLIVW